MDANEVQLPAGVRAALLDKQQQAPVLANGGQVLAVYANDVQASGTAHEVLLTFAARWGGNSPAERQVVQEVARVTLSWPGLEMLAQTLSQLLVQAQEFRLESLRQQLQSLERTIEQVEALRKVTEESPDGGEGL